MSQSGGPIDVTGTLGISFLRAESGTLANVQLLIILLLITLGVALISRRLRLPYTLVLVLVGLAIGFSPLLPTLHLSPDVISFLFLPALLFEGAWSVEIKLLRADWLSVLLLAVPGLLFSLLIVAVILHWSIGFPWLLALLVGAIISPTDPVAVLALLRQLGLSARLRTIVEGESLLNDGVGAAFFQLISILLLASSGSERTTQALSIWQLLLQALWLMVGGFALGIGIGVIVAYLLRLIDDYLAEMTITLIVAYGVYLLGTVLETSGLLAVVGAGLVMGSYGQRAGMSKRAQEAASEIWEFIGYIANSLLFLLLGVQIGASNLLPTLVGTGWAVVGVIVGRAVMIYMFLPLHDLLARYLQRHYSEHPARFFPHPMPLPQRWRPIILLSGLRGALSIALVLSLSPLLPQQPLLDGIVYGVVLFTLLGQGLGLRFLLPIWGKGEPEPT